MMYVENQVLQYSIEVPEYPTLLRPSSFSFTELEAENGGVVSCSLYFYVVCSTTSRLYVYF